MNVKKGMVILGLGLLMFGLVVLGSSFVLPIKTDVSWYTKVGSIGGIGLFITVLGVYLDNIKSLFTSQSKIVAKEEKPNILIDLELSMEKDYQCVNYLSKRFKSMSNETTKKEGLRLLSEAHGLLYKDYHLEEISDTRNTIPST